VSPTHTKAQRLYVDLVLNGIEISLHDNSIMIYWYIVIASFLESLVYMPKQKKIYVLGMCCNVQSQVFVSANYQVIKHQRLGL